MIEIKAPKGFNFVQTVTTLQRGPHDPINQVNGNVWTRIFRFSNQTALIQIEAEKIIHAKVLVGRLKPTALRLIIEESLGLDDPILLNKVRDIPFSEKIESLMGLAVPGYPDLFEALVQIIMGQQVSVVVANKIRANFTHQLGGELTHQALRYKHFPHPQTVLNASIDTLRGLGLSQVKAKAIMQLAEAFTNNLTIQRLDKSISNNDIRIALTSLYGVGDWTVDWLLLRGFRRFEVIPNTDLAVRKAFTWWLNKRDLMSAEAVKRYEKKLYPYGGVIAYRVLCAYGQLLKRQSDV